MQKHWPLLIAVLILTTVTIRSYAGTIFYQAIPAIQSDAQSGVAPENAYTSAIGAGNTKRIEQVVNGVPFSPLLGADNNTSASHVTLSAATGTLTNGGGKAASIQADGILSGVLSSMVFNNGASDNSEQYVVLDPASLTTGKTYDLRVYICNASGQNRQVNLSFVGDGNAAVNTDFFNEDDAKTSAGGFSDSNQVYYINYRFTWDGVTTPGFTVTQASGSTPFCLYALTNQEIPISASATASLPAAPALVVAPQPLTAPAKSGSNPVAPPIVKNTAPVSNNTFYDSDTLKGNGRWVDVKGHGRCWQPTTVGANWRPYSRGRWVQSPQGTQTWDSDEPFGWATYHYGRWFQKHGIWYWSPGTAWAPSWVSWRNGDSRVGWAPLPPDGMQPDAVDFNFVNTTDFGAPSLSSVILSNGQNRIFFTRTAPIAVFVANPQFTNQSVGNLPVNNPALVNPNTGGPAQVIPNPGSGQAQADAAAQAQAAAAQAQANADALAAAAARHPKSKTARSAAAQAQAAADAAKANAVATAAATSSVVPVVANPGNPVVVNPAPVVRHPGDQVVVPPAPVAANPKTPVVASPAPVVGNAGNPALVGSAPSGASPTPVVIPQSELLLPNQGGPVAAGSQAAAAQAQAAADAAKAKAAAQPDAVANPEEARALWHKQHPNGQLAEDAIKEHPEWFSAADVAKHKAAAATQAQVDAKVAKENAAAALWKKQHPNGQSAEDAYKEHPEWFAPESAADRAAHLDWNKKEAEAQAEIDKHQQLSKDAHNRGDSATAQAESAKVNLLRSDLDEKRWARYKEQEKADAAKAQAAEGSNKPGGVIKPGVSTPAVNAPGVTTTSTNPQIANTNAPNKPSGVIKPGSNAAAVNAPAVTTTSSGPQIANTNAPNKPSGVIKPGSNTPGVTTSSTNPQIANTQGVNKPSSVIKPGPNAPGVATSSASPQIANTQASSSNKPGSVIKPGSNAAAVNTPAVTTSSTNPQIANTNAPNKPTVNAAGGTMPGVSNKGTTNAAAQQQQATAAKIQAAADAKAQAVANAKTQADLAASAKSKTDVDAKAQSAAAALQLQQQQAAAAKAQADVAKAQAASNAKAKAAADAKAQADAAKVQAAANAKAKAIADAKAQADAAKAQAAANAKAQAATVAAQQQAAAAKAQAVADAKAQAVAVAQQRQAAAAKAQQRAAAQATPTPKTIN